MTKPFLYFIGKGNQVNSLCFYIKIGRDHFVCNRKSVIEQLDGTYRWRLVCRCKYDKQNPCQFKMFASSTTADPNKPEFHDINNWKVEDDLSAKQHTKLAPDDARLPIMQARNSKTPRYCNIHQDHAWYKNNRAANISASIKYHCNQSGVVRKRHETESSSRGSQISSLIFNSQANRLTNDAIGAKLRQMNLIEKYEVPSQYQLLNGHRFYLSEDDRLTAGLPLFTSCEIEMFITDKDIEELKKNTVFFIDGTFNICKSFKKKFQQLIVVSVRHYKDTKSIAYPICFIFASNKSKKTYKLIFRSLQAITNNELKMDKLITDFEGGLISWMTKHMQDTQLSFCYVHLIRAWRRNAHGLVSEFHNRKSVLGKFWKFLKGIAFIPLDRSDMMEYVLTAIAEVQNEVNSSQPELKEKLMVFVAYLKKNYIGSTAKYNPRDWATVNYNSSLNHQRESTNNISYGLIFRLYFLTFNIMKYIIIIICNIDN